MRQVALILSGIVLAVAAAGLSTADAKVVGKNVEYHAGGTTLKGYLAYDSAQK